MPFELQEEFAASSRNTPIHVWQKYTQEMKGKVIAANIIKSRLESVERFYRELESEKETNKGGNNGSGKKAGKS